MEQPARNAIEELAARFPDYDWTLYDVPGTDGREKTWRWLGDPGEEVMVCVYKGRWLHEQFHRQDFFFFNFACQGSFNALSRERDNRITVREGELCAGQPFTGYALHGDGEEEIIIVGVLVQKELFFRTFLPLLSSSARLLHFFLDPEDDVFSNKFLHLGADPAFPYRALLDLMVAEYAFGSEGSQETLRPMALALTTYAMRQYERENPREVGDGTMADIVAYIAANPESASLRGAAEAFSYHPNYLSSLVRKETGKTFSQIQLEQRMKRADLLLKGTTLPVEDVAAMVGYASTSNFYKAFRKHFGHSPRGTAA